RWRPALFPVPLFSHSRSPLLIDDSVPLLSPAPDRPLRPWKNGRNRGWAFQGWELPKAGPFWEWWWRRPFWGSTSSLPPPPAGSGSAVRRTWSAARPPNPAAHYTDA